MPPEHKHNPPLGGIDFIDVVLLQFAREDPSRDLMYLGYQETALALITERMGVRFDDIESFYVAGSFGEHINPKSAVTVGMLPDIPLDRFKNLGNSAGLGACMMLISHSLRDDIEEIRAQTTYTQLTTDNEFMNRLSAAIFLPHTDRELFPSVPRQG